MHQVDSNSGGHDKPTSISTTVITFPVFINLARLGGICLSHRVALFSLSTFCQFWIHPTTMSSSICDVFAGKPLRLISGTERVITMFESLLWKCPNQRRLPECTSTWNSARCKMSSFRVILPRHCNYLTKYSNLRGANHPLAVQCHRSALAPVRDASRALGPV